MKPVRADARRNREVLIACARDLFAAGDEHLRFDDFAHLAGVGVGTLYRHFPTREALATAVYRQEVETLCALAGGLRTTSSAGEALAAFLRGMVEHIGRNQRLASRLAALLGASPEQLADAGLDLEQAVADLVAAAVLAGAIRADARSGAVLMTLHGIGASRPGPEWRADADAAITTLIDGLRAPPSPA